MPTIKIMNSALRSMLPSPEPCKQILCRDTDLAGFGVRISHGEKMTYIVQRDVKGEMRRITVGPGRLFSLALSNMLRGIDPEIEKCKLLRARYCS
jgi:hypothetical protein